jgi:phenylacetic acid degradation protein/carnitine operon protein CaiE
VVGNPAKIIKEVSDDMIKWKTKGTSLYQQLPSDMRASWQPCEPLREKPVTQPGQEAIFKTWNQTK